MDALNYAAQAVRALRSHGLKKDLRALADLIERAEHFQMPDNGLLFDDDLKGLCDTPPRLPYPVVSLEYTMKRGELTEWQMRSSKRVALAIENLESVGIVPLQPQPPDTFAVMSICYLDDGDEWTMIPACVYVPYSGFRDNMTGSLLYAEYALKFFHRAKQAQPNITMEQVHDYIFGDVADEVRCVMEFCEALTCSNIEPKTIQSVAPNLNARRVRDGKVPLYTTKVLTVEVPASHHARANKGGTHASPRMHLRRGHVRTYQSGLKKWIQSMTVGDPSRGVVRKTYKIEKRETA